MCIKIFYNHNHILKISKALVKVKLQVSAYLWVLSQNEIHRQVRLELVPGKGQRSTSGQAAMVGGV